MAKFDARDDGQLFAEGNNEFALNMYGQLRKRPGNLFLSPYSVRTVMAMAQAGASGVTAAQMSEVLRASPQSESLHLDGGEESEMAVANSLWAQEGEPLRREFLDVIARRYGGVAHSVDFRGNAEAARVTINQWIEGETRRKIRDVIPSNALNDLTRLVLVNAVYFKGAWEEPFPMAATRDEPFYLDGGGEVQAPLMHLRTLIRYAHVAGCQAIDLAYSGDDLSMLVLLPDEKNRLLDIEEKISARMLHNLVLQMQTCIVRVSLPRFKITAGPFDLRQQLTALGMPVAFDPDGADFSGINGRKPPEDGSLFISAVFHKAFVETDEEGTEAAAVSATVMVGASLKRMPPRPVFRADHPFLFAIRDRMSGALLFLGRVSDPTKER